MEQKIGEGKQKLKKKGEWDKRGQGVGAVKRGAGPPLRTMILLVLIWVGFLGARFEG